jgi:tripartite-type tricarboxylate transporter receptor subunit TctC
MTGWGQNRSFERARSMSGLPPASGPPLGITAALRSDLPTVGEFVPGYEITAWFGVGAPQGTPAEVIDKINTEITTGLADPKMKARLADFADVPMPMTPTEFGKLIADETEKWRNVIRVLNIKAE